VRKKLENRLNRENRKKPNRKKKPIKPINFLKKPAGSVRFRFYKQKTEKTEPNRNRQKTGKKTEPNQKNRAKPV
jgi:hypothetical protein